MYLILMNKLCQLLVAQMIKNLPAMHRTQVQSLSWEDSPRDGNSNPLQYILFSISNVPVSKARYSP